MRCNHCPSSELRRLELRPIDVLLVLGAVRRLRCVYCGCRQWRSSVPRPLRWVACFILLVLLYLASPGPIDWIHLRGGMTVERYDRINYFIYSPIDEVLGRETREISWATDAYWEYRDWWRNRAITTNPLAVSE